MNTRYYFVDVLFIYACMISDMPYFEVCLNLALIKLLHYQIEINGNGWKIQNSFTKGSLNYCTNQHS